MNLSDKTMNTDNIDEKVAKVQGWDLVEDFSGGGNQFYWQLPVTKQRFAIKHYHPSTNPAQAMELLKKYKIDLEYYGEPQWVASIGEGLDMRSRSADTPEMAICLATIAALTGGSDE